MCGSEPCSHERGDAITSFVTQTRALVKVTAERDAALARNERQRAILAKVRAIVADPDAALVVDRIREVLEPTPKGKP
jgi:hypothetical protein